ncbi:hypothetical protein N7493_009678 [Penicillium malachiteum]|uniref:Uncharacterized protein n=1 Tax=Penicillium malachiteum TaxID=1324776 RepID=A0AAD6HEN2_9EURO|nr:hypothetical protein N7493_009678 [Penicillium malachiteum]
MAHDISPPSSPLGDVVEQVQSPVHDPVVHPEEADQCSSPPTSPEASTSTDPEKYWLPFSLRSPFLLCLAVVFFLIAVGCEVMRQYSYHHQGLIHLNTYQSLNVVSGLFGYIPTTVAVLLVTIWNICALDVLRLEPYFQLAKPEGTSGSVLFTNYCFTYGFLAPIRAFRDQHWVVFVVSAVALLLRTSLPSIMSGMIVLDEKNIVSSKPINTWPSLVDPATQSSLLADDATHSRNSSVYHLDTFFFYQTHDYVIPPIVRLPEDDTESSTWKMNQTAYWADTSCVELSLTGVVPGKNFDNSTSTTTFEWNIPDIRFDSTPHGSAENCLVSFFLNSYMPSDGTYQLRHWEPLGHKSSLLNSTTMNSTGCEAFALFGLGIDIGSASENYTSNATVFGCTSSYRNGSALISFPVNTSYVPAELIAGVNATLNSSQINIASFEDMLKTKYINGNLNVPGSWHRLPGLTTSTGVNGSLVSDLTPITMHDYEHEIEMLWNQNFVNMMKQFFNTTGLPVSVTARQSTDTVIYRVTTRSALISEALLMMGFVVLLWLAFVYPRRLNFLHGDPGSIAAQCAILADMFVPQTSLARSEIGIDQATPRQLRHFGRTLSCRWISNPEGGRLDIIPSEGSFRPLQLPKSGIRRNPRPHFLTPPWFLIECAVMAGVLAAFGVAFQYVRLDEIDSTDDGVQFIYGFLIYGPTVIASIIGTLFISIYRHLSNLEPWVRLQSGMAAAKQSVTANYGSQTPFMSWRTFRQSAPPILILLTIMCFLDMFMTVASSGMFEPILYNHTEHTSALSARFNESRFLKPDVRIEFTGNSFISDGLVMGYSLLAWTTPNTSFYPLNIISSDPDYDWEDYHSRVRGVGANLTCSEIPTSNSWRNSSTDTMYWTYSPYPSLDTNCTARFKQPVAEHHLFNESVYFRGPIELDDVCQKSFVVITYDDFDSLNATRDENSTVFQCAPQIQIEDFFIDFEYEGTLDDWSPVPGSRIQDGEMHQNASACLIPFTQAFVRQTWLTERHVHPNQYDWAVGLIRDVYDSFESLDSMDLALLRNAVELGYQSTFSTYLSLWREIYFEPVLPNSVLVNGTTTDTYWGIEPSYVTIFIILVLLSIDLAVLMAVFWFRHRHYNGPPIPRSIGALIPLVTNSRMLSDFRGTANWTEKKRRGHLDQLDQRYRYGQFFLVDGQRRLALDYDEKPRDGFEEGEQQHEMGVLEARAESPIESPVQVLDQSQDQDMDPPSAVPSSTHLIHEHNDRV